MMATQTAYERFWRGAINLAAFWWAGFVALVRFADPLDHPIHEDEDDLSD